MIQPAAVHEDDPAEPSATDPRREVGRFEGAQPGPTVVIVGAVHGNEPAGLIAAQRVLERLHEDRPSDFCGKLVVLAGNLAAMDAPSGTRYLDIDLNRMFTPERMNGVSECVERREALELDEAVRTLKNETESSEMFVLDLHTTSAPAPPVFVVEDSLRARAFGRSFPLPMLLGFEEEVEGFFYDHVTQRLGCVACVVEGGQHDDPESAHVHEHVIWTALGASGALPVGSMSHKTPSRAVLREAAGEFSGRVFDVRHREPVRSPDFAVEPGVGANRFVRRGDTVAYDAGVPVRTPLTGRVFLPNMQPIKRPGDDAFFIIREVSGFWLWLSAGMRRLGLLRRLVPFLPGVHWSPDDPRQLLVDARIAAVLKRQLFHLLGYRLVRHGREHPGSVGRRALSGTRAFLRAVISRRKPVDASDPLFWIVARRKLDREAR